MTGAAAANLLARAVDNTRAASSVRVTGQGVPPAGNGGQRASFNVTLVKNTGCDGNISFSSTRQFQVVATGGYIWVKPSRSFYESLHLSKQEVAMLENKYIKVKSDDRHFSDIASFCTLAGLLGPVSKPAGTSYAATPITYQGKPAYKVTRQGKAGYAYVSATGTPLLLRLAGLGASGSAVTFSEYNAAHKITPPSDAESINGGQLGI